MLKKRVNKTKNTQPKFIFSGYQKFVIALLSFLQFTVILDFMILSPLGAIIMPELDINPSQFGLVVSAYAFSAGLSGLLAAGFADRFDRKKLLLFFYGGFLLGTLFCAFAATFPILLVARIVTGLFGGVIGAIVLAIATDLFSLEMRGRVMGFVQTAFSASQVLGIPMGLYLSSQGNWHAPFFMIVSVGLLAGVFIIYYMKPITDHLRQKPDKSALQHLFNTITKPDYRPAFAIMALLATGGFMLMPFASAFVVNNLEVPIEKLPIIYLVTGIFTMLTGPLIGKASDKFGKFNVFIIGTVVSIMMIFIYSNLGKTPYLEVIVINILLFVGIFSRMIPSQALLTAIPEPKMRGAFNAVGSSIQQVSGGIASVIAGLVVSQTASGKLENFNTLGYIVIVTACICLLLMYRIHKTIPERRTVNLVIAEE